MTRYYYDCPIEASFMAKRHGFSYLTDTLVNDGVCAYAEIRCVQGLFKEHVTIFLSSNPNHRYYLTPESEAMLRLQDGDTLQTDAWQYETVNHSGVCHTNKNGVIIHRNRHPFIMPKSEEMPS